MYLFFQITELSESENLEEQYQNNVKKWQQNGDDSLCFIFLIKKQMQKVQEKNEIQLNALNQVDVYIIFGQLGIKLK